MAGLQYVWASVYLRVLAGWSCVMGSALAALPLVVVVLLQARGAGPLLTGVAYAVAGVGGLLGAAATPWMIRRLAGRRLVLLGSWALVATTGAIAVVPHPLAIATASGLAFFLLSPLIVVINAFETRTVPDAMQGRVQTVMLISELSLVWAALLAVGALADALGPASAALALATVFTAVAVISQVTTALRQLDEP